MSRPSSSAMSHITNLVLFTTSVPPGAISPWYSSIVLATPYAPMSIVVMLTLPERLLLSVLSGGAIHRWTTCISLFSALISKSSMRESVPLNLISFISPWPSAWLPYTRRYEWLASLPEMNGLLATKTWPVSPSARISLDRMSPTANALVTW